MLLRLLVRRLRLALLVPSPPLALLHSKLLSHREWEPLVEELSDRFRLILPDLPLHGDSEDRPRHPYTPAWMAEVMAGFCRETCGPRPLVGGHEAGAQLLLASNAGRGFAAESGELLAETRKGRSVMGTKPGVKLAVVDFEGRRLLVSVNRAGVTLVDKSDARVPVDLGQ